MSVINHGRWDVRRIELEVVFFFGSQAQCVNVIFDLLILLGFLTPLNGVRYYLADEVRFSVEQAEPTDLEPERCSVPYSLRSYRHE